MSLSEIQIGVYFVCWCSAKARRGDDKMHSWLMAMQNEFSPLVLACYNVQIVCWTPHFVKFGQVREVLEERGKTKEKGMN